MSGTSASDVEIIYAEDEFVFREIALPAIRRAGLRAEHIHIAEDGFVALEHLQRLQDSRSTAPLLMLLDLRMPGMDGKGCASEVAKLVEQKKLLKKPFMICCSASIVEVTFGEDSDLFHMKLPKPFADKEVTLCLEKFREWRGDADAAGAVDPAKIPAVASPAPAAIVPTDIRMVDFIIADEEIICRMAVVTTLGLIGASSQAITEADELEEATDALRTAQGGDPERPLCVFVGHSFWIDEIAACDKARREPFIVLLIAESERRDDGAAHAVVQQPIKPADLKAVVDKCGSWHLQRKT
jgi:CheY-like chemotaxis protein